ncbi:hypothetical protein NU219Hw_g311t1 [Hortaea werneckii]
MPSIDATVAWAVPVPVEVLGAHFEAYVNLQPTINTLRLCHRFGKGEQDTITRLPVELLSEVEDILMEEERRKRREEWETDFRCFQVHCEPRDHYGPFELEDLTRDIERDVRRACGGKCLSQKDHNEWVEHALYEVLAENFDPTHQQRRNSWYQRVGAASFQVGSFFCKQAAFFHKQFGLRIWTRHVNVDEPEEIGWVWTGLENGETTAAYLRLPNQLQTFAHWWPTSEEKYGESGEDSESGCSVRLEEAKALTESEICRFKRAMDILGLQPSLHESQQAAWNDNRDGNEKTVVDCKPQLTLLLRSCSG